VKPEQHSFPTRHLFPARMVFSVLRFLTRLLRRFEETEEIGVMGIGVDWNSVQEKETGYVRKG
jgi:hypothetical protein